MRKVFHPEKDEFLRKYLEASLERRSLGLMVFNTFTTSLTIARSSMLLLPINETYGKSNKIQPILYSL